MIVRTLPEALPPDPRLVSLFRLWNGPVEAGNRSCNDSLCHGYASHVQLGMLNDTDDGQIFPEQLWN
jgi:hypothetical protein